MGKIKTPPRGTQTLWRFSQAPFGSPSSRTPSKWLRFGCQVNFTHQSFIVNKQFFYQVFTSLISSHYDVVYIKLTILSKAKSGSFFHKSPELLPLKKKRGSHSLLITIWKVVFREEIEKSRFQEESATGVFLNYINPPCFFLIISWSTIFPFSPNLSAHI